MTRLIPTLVAALALPIALAAQPRAGSVAASYSRARALLDSAITAHGGLEALGAASRIAVRMEGQDHWRNQSRRAEPPYDTEPWTGELWLDLGRQQLVWTNTSAFPGGFRNASRVVIDGPRGFNVNPRQPTIVMVPNRPIWSQRGTLFRLPHLLLTSVLDDAVTLRWLGDLRLSDGSTVRAITASTPQGQQLTLGIDPATKRLRAIVGVQPDLIAGDAEIETLFDDYRREGAILIPGRRVARVAGEVTQDVRYTWAQVGAPIPDSLLSPPPGVAEAPPTPNVNGVQLLAPDVWVVRGAGYWCLVVAFNDHVFVMEAPGGGSAEVIARVKELVPGKPIRYIAPSHHHDDHAGGMRDYVAEGATIVTTPGNRAYFERMAQARPTIRPDALSRQPRPPRFEIIADKRRVLTDGRHTVELYDIASPHANEMLVAWLPNERILFQGDLLNLPGSGVIYPSAANTTTLHFADWVRQRGWNVRVLAGVHMVPGTLAQLEEAVAKSDARR